ncbi:MAG: hypothetical protein IT368_11365 [Candidatus Hydrogenedentes bacterium]|nr:hypothetical protein [Candidatus Hydrogenedentota bacterium]
MCLAAFFIAFAGPAFAQESGIQVRAEGHAEGLGLAARRAAIENAREEALIRMIQALITTPDLTAVQPILANPEKYIERFDVLRYDAVERTTSVEIDAFIREKELERDLADIWLPRLVEPPKILLILGEQLEASAPMTLPVDGKAFSTLKKELEKDKIIIEGLDTVGDEFSNEKLLEILLGDLDTGRAFARGATVDVVVLGTAVSHAEPAGPDLYRNRCQLTLRFYRGLDGKMTDARSATAAVVSADTREGAIQAIEDAALKLAPDAKVATVITCLGRQQSDDVLLSIEHPGARARIAELTNLVAFMPFVTEVEELYFSEEVARFRIAYNGSMAQFVDTLLANTYQGSKVKVLRVVSRDVTVTFP